MQHSSPSMATGSVVKNESLNPKIKSHALKRKNKKNLIKIYENRATTKKKQQRLKQQQKQQQQKQQQCK